MNLFLMVVCVVFLGITILNFIEASLISKDYGFFKQSVESKLMEDWIALKNTRWEFQREANIVTSEYDYINYEANIIADKINNTLEDITNIKKYLSSIEDNERYIEEKLDNIYDVYSRSFVGF